MGELSVRSDVTSKEKGTDISKITRKPSKTGKHGHKERKSTKEAKDSKSKPKKVNPGQTSVSKSYSTFRHPEVPNTSIKLLLFPFSLEGEARLARKGNHLRSILTWDDLVSKFINQFFPPSKTTYLRNEITTFYQKPNETFNEAWERFKGLLRQCPHHGFSELHQLDTFYNSLNTNDQDALDSAAGGNFLDKVPRDGLAIIESKSKVRYSRSRAIEPRVSTNAPLSTSTPSNSFEFQQLAASLEDKMDIRMSRLEKMISEKNVTTPATVKAVEEVCVTCGSNHNFNNCPLTRNEFPVFHDNIHQFQQTAAVGNFVQRNPPNLANQMRPPGFNQPNVQKHHKGNKADIKENNFIRIKSWRAISTKNRQNNQGAVYQTPPYQPPTNQPLVNQGLPPVSQIQVVNWKDLRLLFLVLLHPLILLSKGKTNPRKTSMDKVQKPSSENTAQVPPPEEEDSIFIKILKPKAKKTVNVEIQDLNSPNLIHWIKRCSDELPEIQIKWLSSLRRSDPLHHEFAGEAITLPLRNDREFEDYLNRMTVLCEISTFRSQENVHANQSSIIESLPVSPIPVEDSDPVQEEIDIFLVPDDLIPPGVENDDSEDEDIELPNNDHQDDPSIPRPPPEPPDVEKCLEPEAGILITKVFKPHDFMADIPTLVSDLTFILFLSSFLSFGSEDTVFDPGISTFPFSYLKPVPFALPKDK
ncbi:reverse transcriptase domain-containing protein [Tanacetum coccineum]